MNMLSLFSGVGMIDLAASWCGINTVAFCEIEEYPQKILQKRFKGVPIYDDVRKLTETKLRQDGVPSIDIICGGFPCQDVSTAGKRKGFKDEEGNCTRSGLWTEYARLIGEIKPTWVVAENVRGLLSIKAMERRGGDLELFSETWPKWGMMQVGVVTELRMSEHLINGKGYLLWRTPDCSDRRSGKSKQQGLSNQIKNIKHWPTPTVADTFTDNLKSAQQKNGSMHSVNLSQCVNWPTPCVCMAKGASAVIIRKDGKNRRNDRLDYAVYSGKGQLNPDWVEILMGLPVGYTDIDCDTLKSWQGWPAPINTRPYSYEPSRVTTVSKNRANRLKALGNGCVPQQVYPIFKVIMEVEHEQKQIQQN